MKNNIDDYKPEFEKCQYAFAITSDGPSATNTMHLIWNWKEEGKIVVYKVDSPEAFPSDSAKLSELIPGILSDIKFMGKWD